ncbi:MAG TPA: YCF48-related protein, partial [Candidatus Kapabacteria bacterium]|nr:YCF48-related protein [Candidatus Kapabacteria bacterium]
MKRRYHFFSAFLFLLTFSSLHAQSGWHYQLPLPTLYPLNAVTFADSVTATIVGDYGTLFRTTDGGGTWIQQNSGVFQTLYDVAFANAGTGIAVGEYYTIIRTTDGGATWENQNVTSNYQHVRATGTLNAASFPDPLHAFAVGDDGVIVASEDGGHTWLNQKSGTRASLNGVAFADANNGYAVGNGIILYTTNGGLLWKTLADTSWNKTKRNAEGPSVSFCDSLNGFISEGELSTNILHTTDGGVTWESQSLPVPCRAVACINPHKALAVGYYGYVMLTNDSGATWNLFSKPAFTPIFSSIALMNAQNGIAVGYNSVYRTSDSGATWVSETIGSGNTLNSIVYADSNTVLTAGSGGVIFRSGDDGNTWNQIATGTTIDLFGLSFADPHTGYAVGGY